MKKTQLIFVLFLSFLLVMLRQYDIRCESIESFYDIEDIDGISVGRFRHLVVPEKEQRNLQRAIDRWERARQRRKQAQERQKEAEKNLKFFQAERYSMESEQEKRLLDRIDKARERAEAAQRALQELESEYNDKFAAAKKRIDNREIRLADRLTRANQRLQEAITREKEALEVLEQMEAQFE